MLKIADNKIADVASVFFQCLCILGRYGGIKIVLLLWTQKTKLTKQQNGFSFVYLFHIVIDHKVEKKHAFRRENSQQCT